MTRRIGSAIAGLSVIALLGIPFHVARAATLSIDPAGGSVAVGKTFAVTVRLDAHDGATNAVQGTVTWSAGTLALDTIATDGSIVEFWTVAPTASGADSVIFAGGIPGGGYSGVGGTILTLTLRATTTGTATVELSGAKVLSADGTATDLLSGVGGAVLSIVSGSSFPLETESEPGRPTPTVRSSSHPDPSQWYATAAVAASWTKPEGLLGVSYQLTDDPGTVPDTIIDATGDSASLRLPSEGTWYLHLRAAYASGWSAVVHFPLRFDGTPPSAFVPTVLQNRGPLDPTPALGFVANDAVSGIARYTVRIDDGKEQDAANPFELTGLAAGYHTATVTAFDQAGNHRDGSVAFITEGYPAPALTSVSSPLVLLDPLVVRGTANPGDTIVLFLNDREVGRTVLAPGGTGRGEWVIQADGVLRPGTYAVRATATSADGKTSVATDPRSVRVAGVAILFRGRPVATLSLAAPVAGALAIAFGVAAWYLVRETLLARRMRSRIVRAEGDLEELRLAAEKTVGEGSNPLAERLGAIEEELGAPPHRTKPSPPTDPGKGSNL